MQASCRGEVVREVRVGLTFAPYSKRSLTHSKFPIEQASHRGVLPSTFLASTCNTTPEGTILKPMSVFRCQYLCMSQAFLRTVCVRTVPEPLRPAAISHTASVRVQLPHGGEWWSPQPQYSLKLHSESNSAALTPHPDMQPYEPLSSLPRNLIDSNKITNHSIFFTLLIYWSMIYCYGTNFNIWGKI